MERKILRIITLALAWYWTRQEAMHHPSAANLIAMYDIQIKLMQACKEYYDV